MPWPPLPQQPMAPVAGQPVGGRPVPAVQSSWLNRPSAIYQQAHRPQFAGLGPSVHPGMQPTSPQQQAAMQAMQQANAQQMAQRQALASQAFAPGQVPPAHPALGQLLNQQAADQYQQLRWPR